MTAPAPYVLVAAAAVGVQAAWVWQLRQRLEKRGVSLAVIVRLCLWDAIAAALLWAIFYGADLDIEQHGALMWGYIAVAAVAVGMGSAAHARRLPALELAVAAVPILELAAALALQASSREGLAAPPLRALLVAPAALALCGYFGASVGYLLWGAGPLDNKVGFELLIGRRFLLSKVSAVLSTVTTISVMGVALGVWLVLVSLGVLAGFENDLQRKIIGANAHVVVQQQSTKPFVLDSKQAQTVAHVRGVVATAPFLESEVAVASYSTYTDALLFGIDPQQSPAVLSVLGQLEKGSLAPLMEEMAPAAAHKVGAATDGDGDGEFAAPSPLPSIVLGVEMAKGLNVKVGDRVRLVSPVLEVLTPIGPAPKSLGFRVAAIFSSKMYEYDARYVYVTLPAARRFLEIAADEITGLQVRGVDPEQTGRLGNAIVAALQATQPSGAAYTAQDWRQRNQTLFSALKLERVVAFVVLVFIILVASFSIVNTLTMSVIEKQREIAILKTMGARDVSIMKIFVAQGLLVGAFGTFIGTTAGVLTMKALERFGFWIPGDVYYIDSLPVKLEAADVVLVVLAALLIVWDFAVFPALRGSNLEPVEGLRDG